VKRTLLTTYPTIASWHNECIKKCRVRSTHHVPIAESFKMKENDKILFHYTSLEGLLGILSSKTPSIWATNILYLSDASELNYALRLLKEQIRNFQKGLGNALMPEYMFFQRLMEFIEEEDFIPTGRLGYYICSFSQEEDLLSQWRGYCPKGIGVSLGFKFSKLKECSRSSGFLIKRCVYKENKQLEQLRKLIIRTYNQIKIIDTNEKERKLRLDFILKFIKLAPTFKHPKFEAEREWRIIAGLKSDATKLIKFRPVQSMIAPYIEIPLPRDGDNLYINKIVIGPTHERKLSKASIEYLLRSKKVKFDEVQFSTIPYRNW
jgi:hypothetical protein